MSLYRSAQGVRKCVLIMMAMAVINCAFEFEQLLQVAMCNGHPRTCREETCMYAPTLQSTELQNEVG